MPVLAEVLGFLRNELPGIVLQPCIGLRQPRNSLLQQLEEPGYAFEELVAEMNAAFCCASLGIVPTVRHADYIGSWLEVLREDNRAIVRAASQASKAADWFLEPSPVFRPLQTASSMA